MANDFTPELLNIPLRSGGSPDFKILAANSGIYEVSAKLPAGTTLDILTTGGSATSVATLNGKNPSHVTFAQGSYKARVNGKCDATSILTLREITRPGSATL